MSLTIEAALSRSLRLLHGAVGAHSRRIDDVLGLGHGVIETLHLHCRWIRFILDVHQGP